MERYGRLTAGRPQMILLNAPLRCSVVYPSDDKEMSVMVEALNSIVPEHPITLREVHLPRLQLRTQAWNELFRKQLSLHFGVVSFSRSALHPLLWAHYMEVVGHLCL